MHFINFTHTCCLICSYRIQIIVKPSTEIEWRPTKAESFPSVEKAKCWLDSHLECSDWTMSSWVHDCVWNVTSKFRVRITVLILRSNITSTFTSNTHITLLTDRPKRVSRYWFSLQTTCISICFRQQIARDDCICIPQHSRRKPAIDRTTKPPLSTCCLRTCLLHTFPELASRRIKRLIFN